MSVASYFVTMYFVGCFRHKNLLSETKKRATVRSPSQCISEYGLLVAELDESELTSPDTVTDVEGLALLDNVKTCKSVAG